MYTPRFDFSGHSRSTDVFYSGAGVHSRFGLNRTLIFGMFKLWVYYRFAYLRHKLKHLLDTC